MKQLRLDFSDYSAKEQEKDEMRNLAPKKKPLYLLRVDGIWAHLTYVEGEGLKHKFYEGKTLTQVCEELRSKLSEYRLRCIMDDQVEDYLHNQRIKEITARNSQKTFNFNER